ncbi:MULTISPECIES: glycoside hydrolase family 16 protein [unclassified Pseudonocardia]|uniref:glycoside hydrolase family 16 protein n=1 Tax=unclassified Pseudonocardia TaxID=2619320 RepID=UPI0001FFEDA5|nr:glycoside hydrolase family 16 protein [Pseudonocardia sp. Ae707_Ps1]OLM16244.1 hypothetical protein Ae707Ps1_0502c [Pseudonocardia sp. Ae707_Ps1]
MTADELEDLIRRLVAKGVTVLMFTLGPAGEVVGVTPGGDPAPPVVQEQDAGPRERPPLELGDGGDVCVDVDADTDTEVDAHTDTGTDTGTDTVGPGSGPSCPAPETGSTPGPDDPAPSGDGTTAGGDGVTAEGTTAAGTQGWGRPVRTDDFTGGTSGWSIYDGPGHDGNGRRTPDAVSVQDGVLTLTGGPDGSTAGMAWTEGSRRYGRWEGRVKAPASDPSYNALLLLWPTAENWPEGGELDFMEMMDPARRTTNAFFHYGADNSQVEGSVEIDGTEWHNWALEWTPERITAYVDGEPWFETTDPQVQPPGPMHLCIQLDWFPKGGSVRESTMQVDWVREYDLDGGAAG